MKEPPGSTAAGDEVSMVTPEPARSDDPPSRGKRGRLRRGDVVAERYRVVDGLGDGASGCVYLADVLRPAGESDAGESDAGESVRPAPGTRVALKVIHRHLIRDEQVSRRFNREAKLLRGMKGQHLVPLLDHGQSDDGRFYIALELVEGTSLESLIRERLPVPRVVDLTCQMCVALEEAHGRGIVHRDLKPGNVIVQTRADGTDRIRVLDFGMAKILRGEATDSVTALTEQNMVFGTPEYMAPEQARGDEVDARADIYALGIILYELLCGRLPFHSNTPIGMMTAHLSEPVVPPSKRERGCDLPPALEAVVLHALAKHPEERYPNAVALATALRSALTNPADTDSIAPPRSDGDFPTRDTALDMRPHLENSDGSEPPAPETLESPSPRPDGTSPDTSLDGSSDDEAFPITPGWIAAGVVAALIGISIGLLFSALR